MDDNSDLINKKITGQQEPETLWGSGEFLSMPASVFQAQFCNFKVTEGQPIIKEIVSELDGIVIPN